MRTGRLPQREILGVALVRLDLDPVAGAQLVETLAGELAVAGERADVEVDRAVDLVGEALFEQAPGEVDHLRDVLRRPRVDIDRQDVDRCLVFEPRPGVELGNLGGGLALHFGRELHAILALVEGVVAEVADIGDVLDVPDPIAEVDQGAAQDVREEEAAQVADMRVAVDGRATGVDAHEAGNVRLERLDAAAQRVVEADRMRGDARGRVGVWRGGLRHALRASAPRRSMTAVSRLSGVLRSSLNSSMGMARIVPTVHGGSRLASSAGWQHACSARIPRTSAARVVAHCRARRRTD